MLNKRFVSGLAAGLFGLIVIILGGWWLAVSLGVIVHLALLEFFRMAEFKGIRPATKTTLLACQMLLLTTQLSIDNVISSDLNAAVLPLSGAAICCWLLLQPITGSIADIAASIFGLFYLGFLPSHWLKLRNFSTINLEFDSFSQINIKGISLGMAITLAACLIIVAFDIGSYFFGRKLGRTTLSPISPSKTVEGALGGFFCAILMGIITSYLSEYNFNLLIGCLLGFLVALFALVGDLTESMMKRDAGLKDSGNAIPGHGGILDRIDSYLFTPAVVFYIFVFALPLIIN